MSFMLIGKNWAQKVKKPWRSLLAEELPEGCSPVPEKKLTKKRAIVMPSLPHEGPTEGERIVRVRYAQSFFRQTVLASYGVRCCITGNPIPELLVASHILPWSKYLEHRINSRNGLCLSRTHDAAFDNGLITFDHNFRLVLSKYLEGFLPNETLDKNFVGYASKQIRLPDKFLPDVNFLRQHREEIFRS
jgi:predicted restriction endonuclease